MNPFKEQKLVVMGENAQLVFDDTQPWEYKLAKYKHTVNWVDERPVAVKSDAEFISLEQSEPLKDECLHFLHCVTSKDTPRTDAAEGLRVLKVLNKLQHAMDA